MLEKIMEMYKGTSYIAPIASGVKGGFINDMSDCDCTNCVDCIFSYEELLNQRVKVEV